LAEMIPPVNALAKFKGQNDFEERGFRACVQRALEQTDQKIVGKKRGRRNAILGFMLGQRLVFPPPSHLAVPTLTHVVVCAGA